MVKDSKEKWLNILRLHFLKRLDQYYRKLQTQKTSFSRALRYIKSGKYQNNQF